MRQGKLLKNMKSFKEKGVTYAVEIDTADGGGTGDVPKRYGFSFDYVLPMTDAKHDWSDVDDETWVIDYKNGHKVIYSGVKALGHEDITTDFEKEIVMTINFRATSRTIQ
jgi:hypothetical protein